MAPALLDGGAAAARNYGPHYICRSTFRRRRTIATTAAAPPTWTIKDAEKLYNMSGWGLGYFRVSPEGHVTVHPDANRKRGLDLYQLAMDLNAQGVGLPLLLRFSDILRSRIQSLASEFASAIKEFGYGGTYTTVYPVKVNQQRHVVQEIVEFGAPTAWASSAAASRSSRPSSASTRAPTTSSSATATRTRSSCGWRSWGRSSGTR